MSALVVTTDLFRNATVGLHSVRENALWIYGLMRTAAPSVFDEVRLLLSTADGGALDTAALLRSLDLPPSPTSWAWLSTHAHEEQVVRDALALHLVGAQAVVGFGLPPSLMHLLNVFDLPFIDLELSQIRMLANYGFRARSNRDDVQQSLCSIAVQREQYVEGAQRMLSARSRRWEPTGIRRGAFFGQTHVDLALVQGGRLVTPYQPEVLSQMAELVRDLDELHVVPHPGQSGRLSHLLPLLEQIPNAFASSADSYALLADCDTVRALSLSSGTLVEAHLLGLETKALITADRDNPDYLPHALGPWTDVDDTLFSTAFLAAFVGEVRPLQRRPPELVADALGRNVRTLSTAVPHRKIPKLRGNSVQINFSDAAGGSSFLQFGWSDPEPWGTWSLGNVSTIAFRVAGPGRHSLAIGGPMLALRRLDFGYRPDVRLILKTADHVLWAGVDISDGRWSATFMFDTAAEGQLVSLLFRIAGATTPKALGLNDDERKIAIGVERLTISPAKEEAAQVAVRDSRYYQEMHRHSTGYLVNNWLSPFASVLLSQGVERIVECATGNGEFADALAPLVESYTALDWAPSQRFPHSAPNVHFLRWDAYKDDVPSGDLVCSADFLEHLEEPLLDGVLRRMFSAAPKQFHVIACYDDFHSHLIIESPHWWLERFNRIGASMESGASAWSLLNWGHRDPQRPIAVLSNMELSDALTDPAKFD